MNKIKAVRWGLKIAAICGIIALIALNVYYIMGVMKITVDSDESPQFYATEEGIGINYSIYIDNQSPFPIRDIEMRLNFQNETGDPIFIDSVGGLQVAANTAKNLTFELFQAFSGNATEILEELLPYTQIIQIVLQVQFTYGLYTLTTRIELEMEGGAME